MVGIVLLGGKTRAELSASMSKVDGAVASRRTPPRIHVVRLPLPEDRPVAEATELRSAAS